MTEKNYFNGDIDHLSIVHNESRLPILRKDFIFDEYQILQSKVYKADAILLILSILSDNQIKEFIEISEKLNLDCIIEAHSINEIERAMKIGYPVIGVNNRNLKTLDINNMNAIDIISKYSNQFTFIAESGIKDKSQINEYNKKGIYNFLIGESILKSNNIREKIKDLLI